MSNWILLEQPGPWGVESPIDSHLPRRVARRLRDLGKDLRIRIVLIRRHGRSRPVSRHCFFVRTAPGGSWMEHAVLEHPADLLEAALWRLPRGEPVGLGEAEAGPLFLVCTNGRRDPCCAERGRPLASTLERAFGDRVWECSHIGGDRFAGNLVCFPEGLYFGRVDPEDGPRVAAACAGGVIDLQHYRGRCSYPFAVQAAEHFLRTRHGLTGVHDLVLTDWEVLPGGEVAARFADRSGQRLSARVTAAGPHPRRLTCHAEQAVRPRAFRLVSAS